MTAPKKAPAAKKAAPKKPQDRKPKTQDTPAAWVVEVLGEEFTVEHSIANDIELLDWLDQINEGQPQKIPATLRRVLGSDAYGRALDLIRDPETGIASVTKATEFFVDLFKQIEALNPNG